MILKYIKYKTDIEELHEYLLIILLLLLNKIMCDDSLYLFIFFINNLLQKMEFIFWVMGSKKWYKINLKSMIYILQYNLFIVLFFSLY